MSQLWPRLSSSESSALFVTDEASEARKFRTSHPAQTYGATGGVRVGTAEVKGLTEELESLASNFGYPTAAEAAARVGFDRAAAPVIRRRMDVTWSEAATRDVWNFLALVPLASLTSWRFGSGNRERWIASDLTRHTWARLWWQATIFASAPSLLDSLSESDLNQLLERRAIGGDPRLTVAFAEALVAATSDGDRRRAVVRDASSRIRRRLAFTETHAMNATDLANLCRALVAESVIAAERAVVGG